MATVLYGINLGQRQSSMVTTNPGPGTTANQLEIQVDLTQFTNANDLYSYLNLMRDQIIAKWHP